uniref:Transmembrane protein n=1 Tax=Noccaea caerulescens TaxID=107243 RepID=A0A1J3DAF7_NOCCA
MVRNGLSNLGIMFLFLVLVLVPCSIDYVLASPQELISTNGWRRKLIPVRSSVSRRAAIKGAPPSPPPPPSSPPPSAISMKRIKYF